MSRCRQTIALALVVVPLLAADAAAQNTGRLSRMLLELYGEEGLIVDSLALLPSGETHSAHFNSAFQSDFTLFNIAVAGQVATIPIPSPASGFTYSYDAESGTFVRSTHGFGPILADRAETIGKGKFSLGVNYQRFSFDQIDGTDLDNIRAVFTHDGAAPGGKADVVTTRNRIKASLDQFTTFFTMGLTEDIDFSVAIPVVRLELDLTSEATVQRIGTADPAVHFFEAGGGFGDMQTFRSSGDASGIGDVHLQLKSTVFKREGAAIAAGIDFRLPSGDELDLLGSGSLGVRSFLSMSTSSQLLSTHFNLGYQYNGESILGGDVITEAKGDLPDQLQFAGGVDLGVHPQVTLAFDILGQIHFDSPRLVSETFQALDGQTTFADLAFEEGTVTQTGLSAGLKLNALEDLLLDVNVLVRLDDGGLTDRVTPLVGIEYSF